MIVSVSKMTRCIICGLEKEIVLSKTITGYEYKIEFPIEIRLCKDCLNQLRGEIRMKDERRIKEKIRAEKEDAIFNEMSNLRTKLYEIYGRLTLKAFPVAKKSDLLLMAHAITVLADRLKEVVEGLDHLGQYRIIGSREEDD